MKRAARCGTWPSPLGADAVAAGSVHLEVIAAGESEVYWLERRPHEGGRHVLVRWTADGAVRDVTPADADVRSRVHEYGGSAGSCCVDAGVVYYVNYADQRLYRLAPGGTPAPLTPEGPWRYADIAIDRAHRQVVCVREDHSVGSLPDLVGASHGAAGTLPDAAGTMPGGEPQNALVRIPLDGGQHAGEIVASGFDFYAAPRLAPAADRLSWICWRHPQMPWDGTELFVATLDAHGRPRAAERVAGGERESIVHPGWSTDGALHFVSDRTGWWNLYRWTNGDVEALLPMNAEFGRPAWELGSTTWAFAAGSWMVVSFCRDGRWRVALLDVETGRLNDLPWAPEPGPVVLTAGRHAVYVGRSSTAPDAVVRVDLETGLVERLGAASPRVLQDASISRPRPMVFPTSGGDTARLFYYPPTSAEYEPLPMERPPLIVISHGGPTSAAASRLTLTTQYWTTRGFAVADVDYRGSTGYGRPYRERLNGEWGRMDVEDCVNAARFLVSRGLADPDRLIIRGASAGGLTALAALTFHAGVFHAGACYYGIADLEALARETHKFERHYTDRLVAPFPSRADVYRERSPIHAVERLACPVIFFHGREDPAVPPAQAELMAAAIRRKGLRADLLVFEGEQHGFRRRETIVKCLEAELAFYADVLGLSQEADEERKRR